MNPIIESVPVVQYPLAVNTQHWFNRNNKRQNDQALYDIALNHFAVNQHVKAIVLPGDCFFWEDKLISRSPARNWKFYGVNNSQYKEQRESMVRSAKENNTKYRNAGISSRLICPNGSSQTALSNLTGYTNEKFNMVYADFCGSWCTENDVAIRRMFHRKLLLDDSLLIITSQVKCPRQMEKNFDLIRKAVKGDKHKKNPLFDNVVSFHPQYHTSTEGIESIINYEAAIHGYTAELVYFNTYKGDKKGHEMMSFVYKIKTQ